MKASSALLPIAALIAGLGLALPVVEPTVRDGAAVMFFVDVTQSMNVADVAIDGEPGTRLELARAAIRRTIEKLPCGTAAGLGIFASHRALLLVAPVESCRHRAALVQSLGYVDSSMAWEGNSEVAKAFYAALRIAAADDTVPALVFITDGHEAPPVNLRHRPRFDGDAGETPALLVGVGGDSPVPIPKSDPTGRSLGFWQADDVLQVDRLSMGRGASIAGEQMAEEDGADPVDPRAAGTPGFEHLSSLRAAYLTQLAEATGSRYRRLAKVDDIASDLAAVVRLPGLESFNPLRLCAAIALVLLGGYFAARWLGVSTSIPFAPTFAPTFAPRKRWVSASASKPA